VTTPGDQTAAAEHAIDVRVEDLAFATADAIAWPVTDELRATTPLLRRLETAGGARLRQQLTSHDALPVGSAVVTGAGDLSVEFLVSAVISSALPGTSNGLSIQTSVGSLSTSVPSLAHLIPHPPKSRIV